MSTQDLIQETMREWLAQHPATSAVEYLRAHNVARAYFEQFTREGNPTVEKGTATYYHSCTHGRIPLSERAKRLMQAYRNAVQSAIYQCRHSGPDTNALWEYIMGLQLGGDADGRIRTKDLLTNLHGAMQDALRARNFNANYQQLSRARGELALYISSLENQTMCETEAPIELKDLNHSELASLFLTTAKSHGRDEVLKLLRKHGSERLVDLKVGRMLAFGNALQTLAASPLPKPPATVALEEAARRAPWNPDVYGANGARDQYMFDKGRQFEASQRGSQASGSDASGNY